MKARDPLSRNIFARLSKYKPSAGEERERRPLEDFCTEALVYLLIQSSFFRERFVADLLKLPCLLEQPLEFHTQYTYGSSRADITLHPVGKPKESVGIEAKLTAKFGKKQLPTLREAFPQSTFLLAPDSYLAGAKATLLSTKPVSWQDVQNVLAQTWAKSSPEEAVFLRQFSDFLVSEGYEYYDMKMNPHSMTGPRDMACQLDEWTRFLPAMAQGIGMRVSPKSSLPKWYLPTHRCDSSFYGIEGKGKVAFIAFEFTPKGDVLCFLETYTSKPSGRDVEETEEIGKDADGTLWISKRASYPVAATKKTLEETFISLAQEAEALATSLGSPSPASLKK